MGTITSLLEKSIGGCAEAREQLFYHVHEELRRVARSKLFSQRVASLQSTDLVNDAYCRLAAREKLSATNRKHFFYLLGRAMHDVLIDHIRAESAQKRGGDRQRQPLVEVTVDQNSATFNLFDLTDALEALSARDADAARVVQLRYYGGMTLAEIADEMNQSVAKVRDHWEYARAWLHARLSDTSEV